MVCTGAPWQGGHTAAVLPGHGFGDDVVAHLKATGALR